MPAARGRHPKPACLGGARSYYRPERWARERLIHTRRAGTGHPRCPRPLTAPTPRPASSPLDLGHGECHETARGIVTRRAETPLGGSGRPRLRPSRARCPRLRGRAHPVPGRASLPQRRSGETPGLLVQALVRSTVPDADDALGRIAPEPESTPTAALRTVMFERLSRLVPDDALTPLVRLVGGRIGQRPVRYGTFVVHGSDLLRAKRRHPGKISVSYQRFILEEPCRVN